MATRQTHTPLQLQRQIAKRVAELLEKREWKHCDLATEAGMKDSYITRVIQAEANLTLKTISALERAFGEPIINVL